MHYDTFTGLTFALEEVKVELSLVRHVIESLDEDERFTNEITRITGAISKLDTLSTILRNVKPITTPTPERPWSSPASPAVEKLAEQPGGMDDDDDDDDEDKKGPDGKDVYMKIRRLGLSSRRRKQE